MSYYILPLVIYSLEGRHTRMDANTYTAKLILLNQASAVLEPMCALLIYVVNELLAVCYVCACLQFDSLLSSGLLRYQQFEKVYLRLCIKRWLWKFMNLYACVLSHALEIDYHNLQYHSNATSHMCACTGLSTHVCKHMSRYE